MKVCMERDVKGMYLKALSRELSQFISISDSYEPPRAKNGGVIVDTNRQSEPSGLPPTHSGEGGHGELSSHCRYQRILDTIHMKPKQRIIFDRESRDIPGDDDLGSYNDRLREPNVRPHRMRRPARYSSV